MFASTASTSTLSADQLKERISVMESMIREHRQELFAYCYDLINFTPKSSNSKKPTSVHSVPLQLSNSRTQLEKSTHCSKEAILAAVDDGPRLRVAADRIERRERIRHDTDLTRHIRSDQ